MSIYSLPKLRNKSPTQSEIRGRSGKPELWIYSIIQKKWGKYDSPLSYHVATKNNFIAHVLSFGYFLFKGEGVEFYNNGHIWYSVYIKTDHPKSPDDLEAYDYTK